MIDLTTIPNPKPALEDEALAALAAEARGLILKSIYEAGAGHVGGPLSVTDILIELFFREMTIDPALPQWPDRDRVILSKGHSSIALYVAMALRGFFPVKELATFDAIDSRLQGHPCMKTLPGIDMSTGSLGQGLSPGVGMALGARLLGKSFRTYVILGDGEIQEGQVWEACFTASRLELDSIVAIVDCNDLPQFGWPDPTGYTRSRPYDNPGAKFAAFGWRVLECNGHDFADLSSALASARTPTNRPTCIIAHTIKGKGVSFMEGDYRWHAKVPTYEELQAALTELAGTPL